LQNNPDYTNGAKGLSGIAGLSDTFTIYAVMVVMMFILHRILNSPTAQHGGHPDDIVAAESLGWPGAAQAAGLLRQRVHGGGGGRAVGPRAKGDLPLLLLLRQDL
jgi:hypothetical protein